MLGYKIPNATGYEIHWELIKVLFDKIPIISKKEQGKWYAKSFTNEEILWSKTSNCSYDRFFGRGKLTNILTESNILIVGIGAIGGSVLKHLVRGGCKYITIVDFDEIESGNICRSEYKLNQINDLKISAIRVEMWSISPFVEISCETHIEKVLPGTNKFIEIKKSLIGFDFIFDCSTDMEMAYMFDRMELKSKVINLSITDKAEHLACIVGGYNVTDQKAKIFSILTPPQVISYYPGTGCQYPTFQASYTDINSLLSFTMKQINFKIENNCLNSFVVKNVVNKTHIEIVVNEY